MKKGHKSLYTQAKNHAYERIIDGKLVKVDPTKALSDMGREILKFHAEEYDATPIFLYKESRGKNVWLDLSNNRPIDWLKPFTKEWAKKRSEIKKKLRTLKDPKKGGSIEKWELYVLAHKEEVKNFIC